MIASEILTAITLRALAKRMDGARLALKSEGGIELAALYLQSPAFNEPAGGELKARPLIREEACAESGRAVRFEVRDPVTGELLLSGSVGGPGDGAELTLSNYTLAKGGPVTIQEFALRFAGTLEF